MASLVETTRTSIENQRNQDTQTALRKFETARSQIKNQISGESVISECREAAAAGRDYAIVGLHLHDVPTYIPGHATMNTSSGKDSPSDKLEAQFERKIKRIIRENRDELGAEVRLTHTSFYRTEFTNYRINAFIYWGPKGDPPSYLTDKMHG